MDRHQSTFISWYHWERETCSSGKSKLEFWWGGHIQVVHLRRRSWDINFNYCTTVHSDPSTSLLRKRSDRTRPDIPTQLILLLCRSVSVIYHNSFETILWILSFIDKFSITNGNDWKEWVREKPDSVPHLFSTIGKWRSHRSTYDTVIF